MSHSSSSANSSSFCNKSDTVANTQEFWSEPELAKRLRTLLLSRQKALQDTRWMRLCLPIAITDPWVLLATACGRGGFCAWNDAQTRYLGLGAAAAWSFTGRKRWQRAQTRFAEMQRRVATLHLDTPRHAKEPPLATVGFAFSSRKNAAASPWHRWPAARLVLPWAMVHQRRRDPKGVGLLTLCVPLRNREDADAVAHNLTQSWLRFVALLKRAQAARGARPAHAHAQPSRTTLLELENEQQWHTRLSAARQLMQRGVLAKVVIARAADLHSASNQPIDVAATVARLCQNNPESTTFAVSLDGHDVFLGATPERLLTLHGQRIETHAVAGTTARGDDARRAHELGVALIASSKEQHEHATVVAQLRARLAEHCRALNVDAQARIVALPRVQHLETRFTGYLSQPQSALALAALLHPTAAVCGWPVALSERWLDQHEPTERGWYAGVVGHLDANGDGTLAVAIRSALVHGSSARVYAGAGIMAESDSAAEWQETDLKLSTIRESLVFNKKK